MEITSNTKNSTNNMSDIEKLKQKLKIWKKQQQQQANNTNNTTNNTNNNSNNNNTTNKNTSKRGSLSRSNSIKEGITFLKRTLSFGDISSNNSTSTSPGTGPGTPVRKGFLAVHVGDEMQRFVIPTAHLSHPAFAAVLKAAEEEFGFQQEGVLRIPCRVAVFEEILKEVDKGGNLCSKQLERVSRKDGGTHVCGSAAETTAAQSIAWAQFPSSPVCR